MKRNIAGVITMSIILSMMSGCTGGSANSDERSPDVVLEEALLSQTLDTEAMERRDPTEKYF